jgi:hypothetical protein
MTERERDVLRAFGVMKLVQPVHMARLLNLNGKKCWWCPVDPPKQGEQCAAVPRKSRERVKRVLDAMVKNGLLVRVREPAFSESWYMRSEE